MIPKVVKLKGVDYFTLPADKLNQIIKAIISDGSLRDKEIALKVLTAIVIAINGKRPIFLSSGKLYNPDGVKVSTLNSPASIPLEEYPVHYLLTKKELVYLQDLLKQISAPI